MIAGVHDASTLFDVEVPGSWGVTVVAAIPPPAPVAVDVAVLSGAERARLAALVRPADAGAFACAHALLRRRLGAHLGERPGRVPLLAAAGRPPAVTGVDIGCSIAHAPGLVMVALAPSHRVGVDVEALDPSLSDAEMAWIEREMLTSSGPGLEARGSGPGHPDDVRHRFLRRWTRTEAVLKALGTGFAAPHGDRPAAAGWTTWRHADLDVGDRHVAALAVAAPARAGRE